MQQCDLIPDPDAPLNPTLGTTMRSRGLFTSSHPASLEAVYSKHMVSIIPPRSKLPLGGGGLRDSTYRLPVSNGTSSQQPTTLALDCVDYVRYTVARFLPSIKAFPYSCGYISTVASNLIYSQDC